MRHRDYSQRGDCTPIRPLASSGRGRRFGNETMKSRATSESPKMFDNTFVDAFSRTHFSVVPLLYGPAVGALLWYSVARAGVNVTTSLVLAVLGFVLWTLAEYWLHRTFFHWVPNSAFGRRMHFIVHGVHHQWPNDKYRLVMPPAVSIALFFIFLGLYWWLMGRFAWAFHAGYVLGYGYYDLMHYYIHHGRPKSAYFKHLRRHHMVHHFKAPTSRFGVSWTLWDRIFGTFGQRAPTSTRSGTLGRALSAEARRRTE